jgi:hypothetical protein
VGETVTVLTPVAQALAYLHGQGFTHADVSPGNVLFTAHGKELRLRLEAANGQHPEAGGPVPHPLPITSSTLTLHEAALLSPWDEAYREALKRMEGTCLVEGERKTHAELTVPIPLHPFMGYLLDVECVPTGSPASTRGPRVFRRHFTTGGFGTIGGLASSVATERPTARFSQPGAFSTMPGAIGTTPEGARLDEHLVAAYHDELLAHGVTPGNLVLKDAVSGEELTRQDLGDSVLFTVGPAPSAPS